MGDRAVRSRLYAGKPGASCATASDVIPGGYTPDMSGSDNATGAENQQERLGCPHGRRESSETIRRPSSADPEEDEMVRHLRRRGEPGVVPQFVSG